MEDAVRRMSGFPAQRLKLWDRGQLRPGMKADVVVFDAAKVLTTRIRQAAPVFHGRARCDCERQACAARRRRHREARPGPGASVAPRQTLTDARGSIRAVTVRGGYLNPGNRPSKCSQIRPRCVRLQSGVWAARKSTVSPLDRVTVTCKSGVSPRSPPARLAIAAAIGGCIAQNRGLPAKLRGERETPSQPAPGVKGARAPARGTLRLEAIDNGRNDREKANRLKDAV